MAFARHRSSAKASSVGPSYQRSTSSRRVTHPLPGNGPSIATGLSLRLTMYRSPVCRIRAMQSPRFLAASVLEMGIFMT